MLDQFRRLHSARPFVPFALTTSDGRTRTVLRAEHAAIAPGGSAVYIAGDSGLEPVPVSAIQSLRPCPSRPTASLASIKLLVFDFDGVWSNNQVLVMQDGTEGVLCNRSDGLGLERLRQAGMAMLVVSKEENPVVSARCRKLKIECRQGIDDKLSELVRICAERRVSLAEMAYVGNDVNDVSCMRAVGVSIAVADAYPEAMAVAGLVTNRRGGDGAVREVCEWFLAAVSTPGTGSEAGF
ncbi:MAG: hypothetical protein GIKADHBN_02123 [Phycisphaerales bacterium]|nr:hypothetical protein [Phycisphaerales bacterium]MCK6478099.1 HAD hydrolase family protein [Phycisphaerales bacterium]